MLTLLLLLQALPAQARNADPDAFSRFEASVLRQGLEQAEKISGYWDPAQRDCSGLVRFLYRQALGSGFKGWKRADDRLHPYASAEDLVHWNFRFVSRAADAHALRTGDLLVYYSERKQPADRFHLMLALKSPQKSSSDALLLYHNGASGKEGAVRKVSFRDLKADSGGEWAPTTANPRFRGVYRWKGWESK